MSSLRPAALRAVVIPAIVAGAFLVGCGDDDDPTTTPTGTPVATESPTMTATPGTTETPAATETPGATETATPEPTGTVDPDDPGDVDDVPFDLDEIDNTDREGNALVVAVRVGSHDGYDRFVLEFSDEVPDVLIGADGVPAYRVGYTDAAIECGSGDDVELDGAATLEVHLPTSFVMNPETGEQTVDQLEILDDYQVIVAVEETCGFEGQSTWDLGVTGTQPYRIFELDSPTRLVIDVATDGGS